MALDRELHVDALADVVGVFDFGLGQRGLEGDAPIHRLLPTVDEALLNDVGEHPQLLGLVALVEREVGLLPIAEHAEAFELRPLQIDIFAGVGVAGGTDGGRIGVGLAGRAQLLGNLRFDGEAMAIPTGHIGRVHPLERAEFDDDVLEDLVQRGADMDIAVGKRRAVVQDELRSPGAGLADAPVEVGRLPEGEPLRFTRHEVGLHGETGLRQVQRVLVVHTRSRKSAEANQPAGNGQRANSARLVPNLDSYSSS